jgi:hypothetical protein
MHLPNLKSETQCWIVCAIGASLIHLVLPAQTPAQKQQNIVITTSIFAAAAIVSEIRSENA